jgi:N utilization substance protein B
MGRRHQAREFAVQILFQIDVTGDAPDDVLPDFWRGARHPADLVEFTKQLVRGAWQHQSELDGVLQSSAEHWKVERMAIVDRNVLRLATFELLGTPDVPPAVIIDEAIEIAKRFGNADSGPFVNGVLDAVRKRLEAGELDRTGWRLPQAPAGD